MMASKSVIMIFIACLLIITKMVNGRAISVVEVLKNNVPVVKGEIAGKTVNEEEFRRHIEKVLNEEIGLEMQRKAEDKTDNEEAIRRHVEKMLELANGIKIRTQVENPRLRHIQIGLYICGGLCFITLIGLMALWRLAFYWYFTVQDQFIDVERGLDEKGPKRPKRFSLIRNFMKNNVLVCLDLSSS